MHFVFPFESAQDGDGVLHRRLADEHRLEPPLQRRVFLDVLAVFAERSGADAVQLAPRQCGFQHVGGVHRALRRTRSHEGVHLVDEQDDLAFAVIDFLEHRFQPVLEFTAVLGARHQLAKIQHEDALVLEAFGHVPPVDALGQPFDDGGFAHAGFADEHRVVLGSARQNLNDAPDLLVPAHHRIQLVRTGLFREIDAEFLQHLIFRFGILVRDALAAAYRHQRLEQNVPCQPVCLEDFPGRGARVLSYRKQNVLRAHKLVFHLTGFVERLVQNLFEARSQIHLGRPAAHLRIAFAFGVEIL